MSFQSPPRTPTHLWVEAKVRELNAANIPCFVVHRGEKMDGVIYLKLTDCQGKARLITQQRDLDGNLEWTSVFDDEIVEESKADEYFARAKGRDPDLWVIEIEKLDYEIC